MEVDNADGNKVNSAETVEINDVPQMPQLTAKLKPNGLSGNVDWQLKIDCGLNENGIFLGPTNSIATTEEWNMSNAIGDNIVGGNATLYWNYSGVQAFNFSIRGTNPSSNAAIYPLLA